MQPHLFFTSTPTPNIKLTLDVRGETWILSVTKHSVHFANIMAIANPYSNAPQITEVNCFPELKNHVLRLIALAKLITNNYKIEPV